MTQTFYDVLGVPTDASTDRIRAAYRERLKASHPDLNDDDDANEVTRRVIRARTSSPTRPSASATTKWATKSSLATTPRP